MKINNFRGDLTDILAREHNWSLVSQNTRTTSKYSHALQPSWTCISVMWCSMIYPKVVFEAPGSYAHCGIESVHIGILHLSWSRCWKCFLFEHLSFLHHRPPHSTLRHTSVLNVQHWSQVLSYHISLEVQKYWSQDEGPTCTFRAPSAFFYYSNTIAHCTSWYVLCDL